MWRCPNCETINDGQTCIVCGTDKSEAVKRAEPPKREPGPSRAEIPVRTGAAKPVKTVPTAGKPIAPVRGDPHEADEFETYSWNKKSDKIIIVLLACISFVVFAAIAFLQITYMSAVRDMDSKNYSEARSGFSMVRFYRNSGELLKECDYKEASDALNNGDPDEAARIFSGISDYKNSGEMLKECDYAAAKADADSGNLLEAYDKYKSLGDYKDCAGQLDSLKPQIYSKGVDIYNGARNSDDPIGQYNEAGKYFDVSDNAGDEAKYRLLIKAHGGTLDNVSDLYLLIGFADTNEIIISDYLDDFLMGSWNNASGDYLKYYISDGERSTDYNLPHTEGDYYKLEGGIHYHGDDTNGWTPQFSFEIENKNKIRVYCFEDGRTRILYRE